MPFVSYSLKKDYLYSEGKKNKRKHEKLFTKGKIVNTLEVT